MSSNYFVEHISLMCYQVNKDSDASLGAHSGPGRHHLTLLVGT